MSLTDVSARAQEILAQVERAVVGKRRSAELVLSGILAGGHVLMEDFPGLGKTLAARSFAQALGLEFARAQFTPDLLPSDLTGSFLYDQRNHEFTFREGPLFTGLLLADEINRTPPKTQAALLEAMQEGQVTVEGETFRLPQPFHVLATANPVEYEGTYPLPEAQLDRFLLRVSFGYPTPQEEWEVLQRRMERQQEAQTVGQVTDAEGLRAMQRAVETVTVDEGVGQYCVRLVAETRRHQSLLMGASPRGSLALLLTSRGYAVVHGRDYVTPEDLKAVAHACLDHRVTVRPELWMNDITGRQRCRLRARDGLHSSCDALWRGLGVRPAVTESVRAGGASSAFAASTQRDAGTAAAGVALRADWKPTPAMTRAAAVGVGGLALSVVLRRPDLLVLATPC